MLALALNIQVSGLEASDMAKEQWSGLMVHNLKEIGVLIELVRMANLPM